ncbi:MAG: carbohydrate ABC transporter permease [Acidimicrobiales bacterium]
MSDLDEDAAGEPAPRSGGVDVATDEVTAAPAAEAAALAVGAPPTRRLWIYAGAAVVVVALLIVLGLAESAIAIAIGVGGAAVYFVGVNKAIDLLPENTQNRLRPWAYVGPVLLFLFAFLVIPALRTVYLSLFDAGGDFVGLENYTDLFSDSAMRTVFRNNLLWIVGVTTFSTLFGLLMAVLADRIRLESLAKSLVFLPMAISFVGASVVWRFFYDSSRLADEDQVGVLNAIWVGLGNDPVAWLLERPWNNFFLIVAMIWMQTGFSMVVLSSAIKGVATELLEAARIDGASEWKVFRYITLPSIAGTVAVVVTTTIILVLKVFDIVRVMTGGRDETSVIANEMIDDIGNGLFERAGALAVILFVAVVPILVYNVRRFRREEAMR